MIFISANCWRNNLNLRNCSFTIGLFFICEQTKCDIIPTISTLAYFFISIKAGKAFSYEIPARLIPVSTNRVTLIFLPGGIIFINLGIIVSSQMAISISICIASFISCPSISNNQAKTRPLSPLFLNKIASPKVATPICFTPNFLQIFAISTKPCP